MNTNNVRRSGLHPERIPKSSRTKQKQKRQKIMKARLARKLISTPIDKLPPYRVKKFLKGKDRRIEEAIKQYEKLKTKQEP